MSSSPGEELLGEIANEARGLVENGVLPVVYLDELEDSWQAIAADKRALAVAAAASDADSRAGADGSGPLLGAARVAVRRVGSRAKRSVGSRVRSLERASARLAVRYAEELSTRSQVELDRARRLGGSSPVLLRFARVSPVERSYTSLRRVEVVSMDPAIEDLVADRLLRHGVPHVVHAECGDGSLLRRLSEHGLPGEGADPAWDGAADAGRAGETGGPHGEVGGRLQVVRAGALEYLGGKRSGSLGALVLSGITDGLRPSSARALVHLAAGKLRRGGTVAIVSRRPGSLADMDPIGADLSAKRPLRPVTWCHLLSRYGFGDITVHDEAGRAHYAVFATR